MDKKKKIVIVLGMIIGAVFLCKGLYGMRQKALEAEEVAKEAQGTVDENSADVLLNIK